MAAGTGGHVMPGPRVAREMQRRGWSVSWLGTAHRHGEPARAADRHRARPIAFAGLRGKGLLGNAARRAAAARRASAAARSILRARRADAVLGMGGYVCFPGGWMAWLRGKPLLLVNADAALLLSNRRCCRPATAIAFGFAGEAAERAGKKAVVTGNPVRAEIEALADAGRALRRPRRRAAPARRRRQPRRAGAQRMRAAGDRAA